MAGWKGSTRRERLPPDWQSIRRRILRRDNHRCMARKNGRICGKTATEVDHMQAGDNHSDLNLQSICHDCHLRKSALEGGEAYAAKRRETASRFRRNENHPGLL